MLQPPAILDRRKMERPEHVVPPVAVVPTYAVPEFGNNELAASQNLTAFLWRGKRTIIAAAICGLLAGVAVGLVSKPVYRAHTSLKVEGFNDAITLVSPLPASVQDYLQNEVKVLESETLARRVAKRLENQGGPMFPHKPSLLQELRNGAKNHLAFLLPRRAAAPVNVGELRMRSVKAALTVRTTLQSQVIDVFFDAPDPVVAARAANIVASEFMDLNREARQQLVQDTTEWENQQAATLKARLQSLNQQLRDFTVSSGLVLLGSENTPAQDRVRQLQDALTRAEADRAAKQGRYEAAAESRGEILPDTAAPSSLRQYEQDLQNMRRQLADLRTIYAPDNYKVTRLTAQIAETETAIERERKQALGRMRDDYLATASLERMLSRSLAGQLVTVQQQIEKKLQYNVIKAELDGTQKQYDSILEKATQAGAASSLQTTSIRLIDPATPPPDPYSPVLPLNMAIGLAIGTLAGAGIVLVGARSAKVMHPGELTTIHLPELGVVPSADGLVIARRNRTSPLPGKFGSPVLQEPFRSILTSILFSVPPEHNTNHGTGHFPSRVITVTSMDPMEGKTTVVTNLGIACALQKRDVLLIDVDLRRPKLHEQFGLCNATGLTTILQRAHPAEFLEHSSPECFVQPTQVPHLWVLTSGPTDAATVNLLYSSEVKSVLQHFAQRFSFIFIDTPPVSIYSDARILGRMSDDLVMVVRANTKSREVLRVAYRKLLEDGIHVLGTILNDWKIDRDQARTYARYYNHYQQ